MTGIHYTAGKQVETVDTNGQPKICPSVQNYPTRVEFAMGGLLNNQLVICGGATKGNYTSVTNNCQRLSSSGQWSSFGGGMKVARYFGSSATVVIQGEDFLWITGGLDSSEHSLKSTELVSSSGSVTSGTNMPKNRIGHCMIVINNHAMVIGGTPASVGREVLIFARAGRNDFSHEDGPSLVKSRWHHTCSTMVSPAHGGRTVAVVAGGYGDGPDTAEILDYTKPGSTWQLSEYLSFFVNYIFFY